MPPNNRLAPPLRNSLASYVPAPLDPNMMPPEVQPSYGLRSRAENLSIGLGRGITEQLRGTKQLVTDPVGSARALVEAARAAGTDPMIILQMLREMRQKAMSGAMGFGEVAGGMLPIGPRKAPSLSNVVKPKDYYSDQFQRVKDLATGRKYPKIDELTGDYDYRPDESIVIPSQDRYGNYAQGNEWTIKRKVGDGMIRLSTKIDNPVVGGDIRYMHADLESFSAPTGTGSATKMYLDALAIAQEKNAGFMSASAGTRSDAADAIYRRLKAKGVPFKLDKDGAWVLEPDKLAAIDLSEISAKFK